MEKTMIKTMHLLKTAGPAALTGTIWNKSMVKSCSTSLHSHQGTSGLC